MMTCKNCFKKVDLGYISEFEDKNICQDCLNELSFICELCDEHKNKNSLRKFNNLSYCESCIVQIDKEL